MMGFRTNAHGSAIRTNAIIGGDSTVLLHYQWEPAHRAWMLYRKETIRHNVDPLTLGADGCHSQRTQRL